MPPLKHDKHRWIRPSFWKAPKKYVQSHPKRNIHQTNTAGHLEQVGGFSPPHDPSPIFLNKYSSKLDHFPPIFGMKPPATRQVAGLFHPKFRDPTWKSATKKSPFGWPPIFPGLASHKEKVGFKEEGVDLRCYGIYYIYTYLDVSKTNGTPKSSILIVFSIINHPFWGVSPYFWKHP